MLEKDFQAHMQLHHDLERMHCMGLMTSPWNLISNNQIIKKSFGEMELEERWKKTPQEKIEEWTKAIITTHKAREWS